MGQWFIRYFGFQCWYQNLQELLLLAAKKKDHSEVLDKILEFDEDDFDAENLRAQIKFSLIY